VEDYDQNQSIDPAYLSPQVSDLSRGSDAAGNPPVAADAPGAGDSSNPVLAPVSPSWAGQNMGICKKDGTEVEYGPPAYDGPTAGPLTPEQIKANKLADKQKEIAEQCEKLPYEARETCKRQHNLPAEPGGFDEKPESDVEVE
jgi:hypothetical protein